MRINIYIFDTKHYIQVGWKVGWSHQEIALLAPISFFKLVHLSWEHMQSYKLFCYLILCLQAIWSCKSEYFFNMEKIEYRAVIRFFVLKGFKATTSDIIEQVHNIVSEDPSLTMLWHHLLWCKRNIVDWLSAER